MPIDGLVVLKGGLALAKAARDWLPKREDSDRRFQDGLCIALRQLYFTPNGVIGLLRDVAEGKKISEARLRQLLGDFNDREWQVQDALHRIDFHELQRQLGISLSTMNVLRQLQYGKTSLRLEIQSEVNRYGQEGVTPNKAKVGKLIASIESLNADIEEIEAAINTRAAKLPSRKRPAPKKKVTAKKKAAPRKK